MRTGKARGQRRPDSRLRARRRGARRARVDQRTRRAWPSGAELANPDLRRSATGGCSCRIMLDAPARAAELRPLGGSRTPHAAADRRECRTARSSRHSDPCARRPPVVHPPSSRRRDRRPGSWVLADSSSADYPERRVAKRPQSTAQTGEPTGRPRRIASPPQIGATSSAGGGGSQRLECRVVRRSGVAP